MKGRDIQNGELRFQTFTLGDWMTNAYFLGDRESREGWVFDPGFEPGELLEFLKEENWKVRLPKLSNVQKPIM